LRAKPYLPKHKRESIIIGTSLDVAEEPQSLPRQDVKQPFSFLELQEFINNFFIIKKPDFFRVQLAQSNCASSTTTARHSPPN
jgi:hypothetical protein